eukprot:gene2067-1252_t
MCCFFVECEGVGGGPSAFLMMRMKRAAETAVNGGRWSMKGFLRARTVDKCTSKETATAYLHNPQCSKKLLFSLLCFLSFCACVSWVPFCPTTQLNRFSSFVSLSQSQGGKKGVYTLLGNTITSTITYNIYYYYYYFLPRITLKEVRFDLRLFKLSPLSALATPFYQCTAAAPSTLIFDCRLPLSSAILLVGKLRISLCLHTVVNSRTCRVQMPRNISADAAGGGAPAVGRSIFGSPPGLWEAVRHVPVTSAPPPADPLPISIDNGGVHSSGFWWVFIVVPVGLMALASFAALGCVVCRYLRATKDEGDEVYGPPPEMENESGTVHLGTNEFAATPSARQSTAYRATQFHGLLPEQPLTDTVHVAVVPTGMLRAAADEDVFELHSFPSNIPVAVAVDYMGPVSGEVRAAQEEACVYGEAAYYKAPPAGSSPLPAPSWGHSALADPEPAEEVHRLSHSRLTTPFSGSDGSGRLGHLVVDAPQLPNPNPLGGPLGMNNSNGAAWVQMIQNIAEEQRKVYYFYSPSPHIRQQPKWSPWLRWMRARCESSNQIYFTPFFGGAPLTDMLFIRTDMRDVPELVFRYEQKNALQCGGETSTHQKTLLQLAPPLRQMMHVSIPSFLLHCFLASLSLSLSLILQHIMTVRKYIVYLASVLIRAPANSAISLSAPLTLTPLYFSVSQVAAVVPKSQYIASSLPPPRCFIDSVGLRLMAAVSRCAEVRTGDPGRLARNGTAGPDSGGRHGVDDLWWLLLGFPLCLAVVVLLLYVMYRLQCCPCCLTPTNADGTETADRHERARRPTPSRPTASSAAGMQSTYHPSPNTRPSRRRSRSSRAPQRVSAGHPNPMSRSGSLEAYDNAASTQEEVRRFYMQHSQRVPRATSLRPILALPLEYSTESEAPGFPAHSPLTGDPTEVEKKAACCSSEKEPTASEVYGAAAYERARSMSACTSACVRAIIQQRQPSGALSGGSLQPSVTARFRVLLLFLFGGKTRFFFSFSLTFFCYFLFENLTYHSYYAKHQAYPPPCSTSPFHPITYRPINVWGPTLIKQQPFCVLFRVPALPLTCHLDVPATLVSPVRKGFVPSFAVCVGSTPNPLFPPFFFSKILSVFLKFVLLFFSLFVFPAAIYLVWSAFTVRVAPPVMPQISSSSSSTAPQHDFAPSVWMWLLMLLVPLLLVPLAWVGCRYMRHAAGDLKPPHAPTVARESRRSSRGASPQPHVFHAVPLNFAGEDDSAAGSAPRPTREPGRHPTLPMASYYSYHGAAPLGNTTASADESSLLEAVTEERDNPFGSANPYLPQRLLPSPTAAQRAPDASESIPRPPPLADRGERTDVMINIFNSIPNYFLRSSSTPLGAALWRGGFYLHVAPLCSPSLKKICESVNQKLIVVLCCAVEFNK